MKIAVAGKGGSGKTSISGTLARVFARRGLRVLAIDGDSNPNLALTLGIPSGQMDDVPTLPRDAIERSGGVAQLVRPVQVLCAEHAVRTPDGVDLLVMANPRHAGVGCLCGMHATVRTLVEALGTDGGSDAGAGDGHGDGGGHAVDVCIVDTEASPEHLSRGTTRHADVMLIVVEPYFKSLETGRRMAHLSRDLGIERILLVANKVRDDHELAAVREFADQHELELLAVVPFDPSLPRAEEAGRAPLDLDDDSPAVRAIGELARELLGTHERA